MARTKLVYVCEKCSEKVGVNEVLTMSVFYSKPCAVCKRAIPPHEANVLWDDMLAKVWRPEDHGEGEG